MAEKTIEITAIRPRQNITLHVSDYGDISFSIYTDSPSSYKTLNDALMRLDTLEVEYRRIILTESLSNEDRGKKYFEFLGKEAEICIEALKVAIGGEEWKNLAPVAEFLPISTLQEILRTCASAVSRTAVERLQEGRV